MSDDTARFTLVRHGRQAVATLRTVPGYGVELRYSLDGELRKSQTYRTETEALTAAAAKRDELTRIGFMPVVMPVWGN
jgi:hypothetical protein